MRRWTSRRGVLEAAYLATLLVSVGGCGTAHDAAVVTITAPAGLVATHLALDVGLDTHQTMAAADAPMGRTVTFPATVALTYPSGYGLSILVTVRASAGGVEVARGTGISSIVLHGVTPVSVDLLPSTPPPDMQIGD